MAKCHDVIGFVHDDEFYCAENCAPELLGYEEDDCEVIFIDHGVEAGTVCESCGCELTEDNEWVLLPADNIERMAEACS